MLVRTPQHMPTESLRGYVLRISETNGYDTPWHLLTHAGLSQSKMRTAGIPIEKLAAVLGRSSDALGDIAYSYNDGAGEREYSLLGHPLGKGLKAVPLRLARSFICPHCIAERGYIDAFFDLNVAVSCPFHRCKLVDHCPSCSVHLTWFRPGLLTCKCGASLADAPPEAVGAELTNLMTAIWGVLHRTPLIEFPRGTNLPVAQLLATPLRVLSLKLPELGEFQIRSTGTDSKDSSNLELLASAGLALSNWPQGFHEFLGRLAKTNNKLSATTFGKRFEHLNNQFFKKRRCGNDFAWLRDEFMRYGLATWDESALDKKMLRGEQAQARFATKADLARRLNVTQATVLSWANQGRIKLKKTTTAFRPRYLADTQDPDLLQPLSAAGNVFKKREAAAYLGIPVRVLSRLKSTGHFSARHLAIQKQGFHQADLDCFREQLLALSQFVGKDSTEEPRTGLVDLARVLRKYRFHDHDLKAGFIVAYLSGSINSAFRTGPGLEQLYFNKRDVDAFVSISRSGAAGESFSQMEAARLIGCDPQALTALIDAGYITATVGREGLRISSSSINKFAEQYVAICAMAKTLETTACRLIRLCGIGAIPLMQVARTHCASPVSFIENMYVEALQRLCDDNPTWKSKADNYRAIAAVRPCSA